MNFRWLMRAAIWVRKPPSPRKVKLFVGLVVVLLAIAFTEYYVGCSLRRGPRWRPARNRRAQRVDVELRL